MSMSGITIDAAARLAPQRHQSYESCSLPEEDPDREAVKPQSFVVAEWCYAVEGSTELLADMFCPLLGWMWPDQKPEVVRKNIAQLPLLKYNPLWWLGILALVVMMIPGHMFHSVLGNGGKVRPDELEAEKQARVGWVYTYSGSFLIFAALYVVRLMSDVYRMKWNHKLIADMMAFSVVILYVAGDAHLLFQMRRRNTIMTHACVISRMTFGLAFLFVLILSLYHTDGGWSWNICWSCIDYFNLNIALGFCFFMCIAVIGYYPLLEISYEERPVEEPPCPWCLWFVGFLSAFGPIVVTSIIGIAGIEGHFGYRSKILMSLPFLIVVTLPAVRVAVYGFTWERIWATLVALGPLLLVTGSFTIAGPRLWSLLAGANP